VQAVDIPALYDWPDVVITSTRGHCSLASLLAGGGMSILAKLFTSMLLIESSYQTMMEVGSVHLSNFHNNNKSSNRRGFSYPATADCRAFPKQAAHGDAKDFVKGLF
jgi:hypothetical protein